MHFGGFGAAVTEHHDQVTTEQRLAIFSKNWWKNPKVQKQLEKFADLAGEIPLPPSSPGSNDGVCLNSLRTLNKVYNMLKAQCKNTTANVCKRKLKMVKPAFDSFKAKCYPSPSRSSKGKNIWSHKFLDEKIFSQVVTINVILEISCKIKDIMPLGMMVWYDMFYCKTVLF